MKQFRAYAQNRGGFNADLSDRAVIKPSEKFLGKPFFHDNAKPLVFLKKSYLSRVVLLP
jgi:hypothetical protein